VSRDSKDGSGGLSLQTLLISSLAAVAAAIVVPMFWERGSILATAITPIIVAVVSEALNRPATVIKTAAPRVTRRTATGAAVRTRAPTGVGARGEGPEQLPPRGHDPFGLYADERPKNRRPLKIALITGLLAFIIGAGVVTVSELAIFGHSIGESNRSTGLWGGREKHKATPTPTPTPKASPTETPAATETPTPSASATPTVSATPTPSATVTPGIQQAAPTATPPDAAPTATP
jgi:hypothetical protein